MLIIPAKRCFVYSGILMINWHIESESGPILYLARFLPFYDDIYVFLLWDGFQCEFSVEVRVNLT